jgi:SAM-dependent methyltransferase
MFSESDGYERFMGRWSRQLAPLLVSFAGVGQGDTVLDVGCGTGALTIAAAQVSAARLTGVDPSSAYVDAARRRTSDDRVQFLVGDAAALGFADATFDRVLSLLVLNFLPDPGRALREMIRVTRPKGVVAAAVWDYGEGMGMLRAFWDEALALHPAAASRDEGHMPLSRRGELTDLWRANGLNDVDEQPLTIEQAFASFDDYWEPFVGGQGPAGSYAVALAEPQRAALRSALRDRFANRHAGPGFSLTARAWAVRGVVAAR